MCGEYTRVVVVNNDTKFIIVEKKMFRGQVPSMTEYKYLDRVKWLEMYGVDLHPVRVS